MRKSVYLIVCITILQLTACDVHEWPELPERVGFHLRLTYETEMTVWEHRYENSTLMAQVLGENYANRLRSGKIRYVIRAYPVSEKQRTIQEHAQEFVFTKDIAEGYDHEVTLDLVPGNYNLMVWSDLVESSGDAPFYNADNFAEIVLQGAYRGNTDYRDAFRGSGNVSLVADIVERAPDTIEVSMERPLAKFEFIATDVAEFLDKEATRVTAKSNATKALSTENPATRVNLENYKVIFYYVGFLHNAYSLYTDKPKDVFSTKVQFETTLKKLTESETALGFDYVFVNGKESPVTVRVGVYDEEGTELSLTEPIEVPLKRNRHTVLRGTFLTSRASGGVSIDPEFTGDYNRFFP